MQRCGFIYRLCFVKVEKLLALLPEDILETLALETKVDRYSKKLQGEVIFKLLLHSLLTHKGSSLRTMESAYESLVFQALNATYGRGRIHYSSISERLKNINALYFEKLYQHAVTAYKDGGGEKPLSLVRFDSTIVTLSSKLLEVGFQLNGSCEGIRQVKFSIGYAEIPETVKLFHTNQYTSENAALKEAILDYEDRRLCLSVFDRGVTSRGVHDQLTEGGVRFISRIGVGAKHKMESDNLLDSPVATKTLEISEDYWVRLYGAKHKLAGHGVRLIKAVNKKGEALWFITNVKELLAGEVTELYKRRWEIEVFFKFLKQHLNFSHFINRSENGIKVTLYTTLIAAVLLAAYKRMNGLKGFKLVKQKMVQDLERELIKSMLVWSKNNPDLFHQLINSS